MQMQMLQMAPYDRLNARIRRCPWAWGEGPPRCLLLAIQTARARRMPMQYGAFQASGFESSAPGDGLVRTTYAHVAGTHARWGEHQDPARRVGEICPSGKGS